MESWKSSGHAEGKRLFVPCVAVWGKFGRARYFRWNPDPGTLRASRKVSRRKGGLQAFWHLSGLFALGQELAAPLASVSLVSLCPAFCEGEWRAFQFAFSLSKMHSVAWQPNEIFQGHSFWVSPQLSLSCSLPCTALSWEQWDTGRGVGPLWARFSRERCRVACSETGERGQALTQIQVLVISH